MSIYSIDNEGLQLHHDQSFPHLRLSRTIAAISSVSHYARKDNTMSAAAEIPQLSRPGRPDSLAQTLLEISRFANGDPDPEILIDFVAARALAIAGVQRIVIHPGPPSTWSRRDRLGSPSGPEGSAMARIATAGQVWGAARIYFSLRPLTLQSPEQLAVFLGQQIAGLLIRKELQRLRTNRHAVLSALDRRLRTRKYVATAAGKIADSAQVSREQSMAYLISQARRRRTRLLEVSILVLSYIGPRPLSRMSSWRRDRLPTQPTLGFQ
jgi:hypothetical protein